ncbi:hypothetical protein [Aureispira sp. CCB-QB1]|uniref:putative ABC transporter permease n=1 Tax=Aureispira sp. CCB-QB1 TaxID=1313421 RepID=UPI000696A3BC|nr:hypothetical protein [Aureispira sp. CCB-QB1]
MPKRLFLCLFFACFGVTTEVIFVAISNLINQTPYCNEPLWSLTGKTYVWMLPIYALIPLIAEPIVTKTKSWHLLLRLIFYTTLILSIEFISGFALEQLTGKCPWEYTTGWHFMGYIRLDYIPAWMFFSFLIEYLYRFIDKNLNHVT